jgi:predicted RND superfamily exporter protein
MKLTNQQIDSLTDVLVNEKEKSLKVINDKKKAEIKAKAAKRAKELIKIYNKIPAELVKCIKENRYDDSEMTETKIINSLTYYKEEKANRSEFRSKVVLASIGCNNVIELKSKLKISF